MPKKNSLKKLREHKNGYFRAFCKAIDQEWTIFELNDKVKKKMTKATGITAVCLN